MNKLFSLFPFVLFSISINAQEPDWQWARYATGIGTQETMQVTTDLSGNAYLAGNFQNDITFGTTTMTLTGVGMYLAKFDPAGNLLWLRTAGGQGSNGVYLLATDQSANTYIAGRFANQVSFGAFTLTSTLPNIYHIFIAKYDSSGNVLWARSAGETGNGYDLAWPVQLDASGNVYISGNIQSDTIPLDSDTLFGNGGSFFLMKYDSSGRELWSRSAVNSGFALSQNLTTDSQANIYVTGYFLGDSVNFPGTTLHHQGSTGLQDMFFASYDSSGNFRWAKSYGGGGTDYACGLATDHADYIYLTGTFDSSPITIEGVTLPNPSGQYNYFLAKFDPVGTMIWLQSDSGKSGGYCVTIDDQNNLLWSGHFYSQETRIDTITLTRPAIYADPIFIAKLDSSGKVFWAKVLASGGDDNNGVAIGNNGDIYLGGDYYQISPFVIGNDSLPLTGIENAFIAKLGFNTVTALFTSSDNLICPGTCTDFINHSINAVSYLWNFPGASTMQSSDENPSNICYTTPGQYDVVLKATGANGSDTLVLHNYITVYPFPNPQGINQSGDTLFANPGSVSYQWFLNGNQITGATSYYYVALQSGDYNVIATDANGCEVEAVIFNVVAGLSNDALIHQRLQTFPNPTKNFLVIDLTASNDQSATVEVSIFGVEGSFIQTLSAVEDPFHTGKFALDVSKLQEGFYIATISVIKPGGANVSSYRISFIKQ